MLKKLKDSLIIFILTSYILILASVPAAHGELGSFAGSLKSTVSGTVGELYLNLSGYVSPFASIVLTSDGVTLRATIADQKGNFSISQVLIKRGFSHFCLEATDFRKIGSSTTCFSIPPAEASVTMTDIFLPPTLALYKDKIPEGGNTLAFGYTMPGALVALYLNPAGRGGSGQKLTTYADKLGYYQFTIKNLKAGKYSLYAKASYKTKESKSPSKTLTLTALNFWQQIIEILKGLWRNFLRFLTSLSWGPLWLAMPILILIIILIVKIWGPGKFSSKFTGRAVYFPLPRFLKRNKHLHHYWFFGY